MGIGGSGCSAVAQLAHARGYQVTGCDASGSRGYLPADSTIVIAAEHNVDHVAEQDAVIISPALLTANPKPEELAEAEVQGIAQTWQQFLGEQIYTGDKRLAVAGSHGKSTTTGLLGLLLEAAELDPTVVLGAKVPAWQTNVRIGGNAVQLVEADEYNRNFMHYTPHLVGLNNVDYEHPEFFESAEVYEQAFIAFLKRIPANGTLVFNATDKGAQEAVSRLNRQDIDVITLGTSQSEWQLLAREPQADGQVLTVQTPVGKVRYQQALLGEHNAMNALLAIALAHYAGANIRSEAVHKTMRNYGGVGRRLQQVAQHNGVTLYDDYGHHPTEIGVTLRSLAEHYPNEQLVAVVEPHQVSRLQKFYDDWVTALQPATRVFITKVFEGREGHLEVPDLLPLCSQLGEGKAAVHHSFEETSREVLANLQAPARVVVFGAGQSVQLTEMIKKSI